MLSGSGEYLGGETQGQQGADLLRRRLLSVLWAAPEQVVADGGALDGDVLARRHELVAALLPLFDEYEGAVDELPAFAADGVEDHARVRRCRACVASDHGDDDRLLAHDVVGVLKDVVAAGKRGLCAADRAGEERCAVLSFLLRDFEFCALGVGGSSRCFLFGVLAAESDAATLSRSGAECQGMLAGTVQNFCKKSGMSAQHVEPPVLLTKEEAAALLRVGPRTLWEWGHAGRLEVVRLTPRTLRYRADSIAALMAGGDTNSGDAGEGDDAHA